ncbi:MAG: thioredoxin domain-containing protein [Crocinitomicaceae bacterium]
MTAKNQILSLLTLLLFASCANSQNNTDKVKDPNHKYTNALINESSPYLLQHAHNPVNWVPWGEEAFEKAQLEDKLVLVSIGYSSCHWCHVMEHESFEDEGVAELMNEHFVCIKVDREERPDVDQIYMSAVQLMTGQGGWPLNCFTLPDGRPIYGGTYFPKNKWVEILNSLHEAYTNKKEEMIKYANDLTQGVNDYELISVKAEEKAFNKEKLDEMVVSWSRNFDNLSGGPNRAPKFPLPNNYDFLMHYAHTYHDTAVMQHVDITLQKMAFGGIYDQIGGGFARYSTDINWKVPHFEKMLYDNAQLVSLYSHAYQRKKDPLYKHIVYQTLEWVEREMTSKEGSFYSALDADSEGEEGKYYVWDKEELKSLLGEDYELIKDYYNVNSRGLWEGNYILLRHQTDSSIAAEHNLDLDDLFTKVEKANKILLNKRDERIRPGLDDKSLTSWNAMMTIGYLDAYQAFGEQKFLEAAIENLKWMEKYQIKDNGSMYHSYKNKHAKIDGFLEDYAHVLNMYVKFYEVTFNESHLNTAEKIMQYVNLHFLDQNSGMYYFTTDGDKNLVARKMELSDNVIPASNSVMAIALWKLGALYDNQDYKDKATQMVANVYADIHTYGPAYSNWSTLIMHMIEPYYEVAITGKDWESKVKELNGYYIPNKILMGGTEGNLPLLQGKFTNETTIYVCVNKSCKMPVDNVSDAIPQLR